MLPFIQMSNVSIQMLQFAFDRNSSSKNGDFVFIYSPAKLLFNVYTFG